MILHTKMKGPEQGRGVIMTFEKNKKICGFTVKEIRESEELCGRTILLEHDRTGAQIFWVDNSAENMVFSITFRTLPEDNTGVFISWSIACFAAVRSTR